MYQDLEGNKVKISQGTINIKPLVFVEDHVNEYGVVPRVRAVVDLHGMGLDKDELVFEVHSVCVGNDFYLYKAISPSLDKGPTTVLSFDAGMGMCNYWYIMYWKKLFEEIKKQNLSLNRGIVK